METVSKNTLGSANYDSATKIIHYKFSGMTNMELAKEILSSVVAFSKTKQIKGIYADLSELKGTFTMLNDYLANEYFPSLIKQGLIANAIIVSNDIFTQFATNALVQKMGSFTIQNFRDSKKGYEWLTQELTKA